MYTTMTSVMTDFPIIDFPYLIVDMLQSPAYGVLVSQLIRYARSKYEDFPFRGSILVSKLGIFFTETSDYFSEILWSSYRPCTQM